MTLKETLRGGVVVLMQAYRCCLVWRPCGLSVGVQSVEFVGGWICKHSNNQVLNETVRLWRQTKL